MKTDALLQNYPEVIFPKTSLTNEFYSMAMCLKNLNPLIQDPIQYSFTQQILTECLYCVQVRTL